MRTTLAVLAALAFVPLALAHSQTYINITGDILLTCDETGAEPNQGGVCDSTAVPDETDGTTTVSITADEGWDASGFYCQDLDGDSSCGDFATIFCSEHTVTAGVDWDSGFPIIVFIDGPVFGNVALSGCATVYSGSFSGSVDHSN